MRGRRERRRNGRCIRPMRRSTVVLALATLTATGASAEDVQQIRNGKIAFWSDLGSAAIFVVNPDGSGERRLTAPTFRAKDGAWSPDGRRIAFYGSEDQGGDANIDIFVMNADGSGRRRLTSDPAREIFPEWLPGGPRIAFTRKSGGRFDTWVMNDDGTEARRLLANAVDASW